MAIQISVTGLTAQQLADIGNAFDETIRGRIGPDGQPLYTKARWVELCMLRHIKAVVKGWKRSIHETSIATEQAAVDAEFLES